MITAIFSNYRPLQFCRSYLPLFGSLASLFHKKHIVSNMKGSSESTSSSKLTWILVQAKKLYWNTDGTTNLPEWKTDVIQATKGAYGIYSVCLVKLKIPDEWIDEFMMSTEPL